MRILPSSPWAAFALGMAFVVLLVTLLPISYAASRMWFEAPPYIAGLGRTPTTLYKTQHDLLVAALPGIRSRYGGVPWLPSSSAAFRGSSGFSASVMARRDHFEIQENAEHVTVSDAALREFGRGGLPLLLGIFEDAVPRTEATSDVLNEVANLFPCWHDPRTTLQHLCLAWQSGTWFVHVEGYETTDARVRELANAVRRGMAAHRLPRGSGIAAFSIEGPIYSGDMIWATPDGLVEIDSRLKAAELIPVVAGTSPVLKDKAF